ncbi:unnamed protein product [Didymodactylos carnosus]|uniref:Uncharacterized protein n=1 Tax=Didymodactylos carnosus TaxID=1234261 RepID=A0A815UAX9_9BILA|nr:unnamed protein product [Didymodactylos carnosus]CAF4376244.1 unnamed protein product [Didymodactylos carnosus]
MEIQRKQTLQVKGQFLPNFNQYGIIDRDFLIRQIKLQLQDNPYPVNTAGWTRRTIEIKTLVEEVKLSHWQSQFLNELKHLGVNDVDLWHGSHIIVQDDGVLYSRWSRMTQAIRRVSSHYKKSKVRQYGLPFGTYQFLFGKTSPHGCSWFQMEAHAFNPQAIIQDPRNGLGIVLEHGEDFLKYRITGENVGPFGFSPHTETNNPIILPFTNVSRRYLTNTSKPVTRQKTAVSKGLKLKRPIRTF